MISRILATLVALSPAAALAQEQPPSQPAPAPQAEAKTSPSKRKERGVIIEGAVGPVLKKYPDTSGLGYGLALRFANHRGVRTEFGLQLLGARYSADDLETADGVGYENSQSQIGGGMEFNFGFGISRLEFLFGAGLGLTFLSGETSSPLIDAIEYDAGPILYASYGGVLAYQAGLLRPALRVTKVIDTSFDSEQGDSGDAGGLLVLLALGLEF